MIDWLTNFLQDPIFQFLHSKSDQASQYFVHFDREFACATVACHFGSVMIFFNLLFRLNHIKHQSLTNRVKFFRWCQLQGYVSRRVRPSDSYNDAKKTIPIREKKQKHSRLLAKTEKTSGVKSSMVHKQRSWSAEKPLDATETPQRMGTLKTTMESKEQV